MYIFFLLTGSMTFLFTINTFTHFKRTSSTIYEEGSVTPTSEFAPSPTSEVAQLPEVGDSYFAIHLISMDVYAESLVVANGGGHIMVFDFLKIPPDFTGSRNNSLIKVIAKQ